jgi:hypothetical protein
MGPAAKRNCVAKVFQQAFGLEETSYAIDGTCGNRKIVEVCFDLMMEQARV